MNKPENGGERVLISGEYPHLCQKLQNLGIAYVATNACLQLPPPVQYHADLQCCIAASHKKAVVSKDIPLLQEQLRKLGYKVQTTQKSLGQIYPQDVACSALFSNEHMFVSEKGADASLFLLAKELQIKPVPAKQGYVRCSCAVVNDRAVITADAGMAALLRNYGVEVLQITAGNILLPGYNTGFIGGCCGLVKPGHMLFTGALSSLPDAARIDAFLLKYGVGCTELTQEEMLDIGGILQL